MHSVDNRLQVVENSFYGVQKHQHLNSVPSRHREANVEWNLDILHRKNRISMNYAFYRVRLLYSLHNLGQEVDGMQLLDLVNHALNRSVTYTVAEVVSCYPCPERACDDRRGKKGGIRCPFWNLQHRLTQISAKLLSREIREFHDLSILRRQG